MNVNYSRGSWKVDIQPVKEDNVYKVELNSEQLDVPIHYTLDGSDPTIKSPVFKEAIIIDKSTTIKAGLFLNGKLKEYFTEKEIVLHKGVGKNAYLKEPPSKKYPANGAISLIDGLKGSDNYRDGYWLGFQGTDMDFEVDLGKEIPVQSVSASFFQNTGSWIFMPEKVQFVILNSEKKKVAKMVVKPEATMEAIGTVIENIDAEFDNVTGRYIKVHAKNIKTLPSWHEGAGSRAWIFVDEIIVN